MSDDAEILKKLQDVFARFFDDPSLTLQPETTAKDVPGWDSLANVELMIEIEGEFQIRFKTGELASLENVGELVAAIARRAKSGRTA